MGQPATDHPLDYSAYLALEQDTDTRHEFLRGDAWAMAGGTLRHAAIKTNLTGVVFIALRDKPCRSYDSDAKVRIDATDLSTYPDLSILCGPVARSPIDHHAATNPTVLFEVVSRSTESWDRGGKFEHYRRLASFRHYVLVGSGEPKVEVWTRQEDGAWRVEVSRTGEQFSLSAVGISLDVDELYADLPELSPGDGLSRGPDPTD